VMREHVFFILGSHARLGYGCSPACCLGTRAERQRQRAETQFSLGRGTSQRKAAEIVHPAKLVYLYSDSLCDTFSTARL